MAIAVTRNVTSTEQLEKQLDRLYEEERKMQQHPSYPFVSDIPGWRWNSDEIDRIEAELCERALFH